MKSKKEGVSPVTAVLIHKAHGGRKQDSKFWQSEFDDNEIQIDKPEGIDKVLKQLRARRSFMIAIFVAICCSFLLVYIRPDLFPFLTYSKIYSTISSHFPSKQRTEIIPNSRPIPPQYTPVHKDKNDVTKGEFTEQRIERAKQEVLSKKQHKQLFSDEKIIQTVNAKPKSWQANKENETKPAETYKYIYEIELHSGGRIVTNNARVMGDKVSYKTKRGLVVAINKEEIKTMKRKKSGKSE